MRTTTILCSLILLAALASCASGSRVTLRPMTSMDAQAIHVGSSLAEVRALIGPPHRIDEVTFGEETDEPWDGLLAVWFGAEAEDFEYSRHYRSNRLAFAFVGRDTLLNHWELDAVEEMSAR